MAGTLVDDSVFTALAGETPAVPGARASRLRRSIVGITRLGRGVSRALRGLRRREEGVSMLELVVALGIGAMLVSVLTSAVLVVLWLPGERSDRITVAQDVQNAEHWISRDMNSASSFVAGASPTYGVFSWSDYTGDTRLDYAATYSYDAASGYLMRTEEQNGVTASTLAVAKNIVRENDVRFTWSPGTYSIQVMLTSTVTTGTTKEGITNTIRSAVATMAGRPRSEPLVSPPDSVAVPPPPPGSVYYSVDGDPVLVAGAYVSGGAAQLQTADSAYYRVDSSSGASKEVIYTVRSGSLTLPATISQVEVRWLGTSDRQGVSVNFYVKDSAAGFSTAADSGFTFTTVGADRTEYFYLSPEALNYVNSLVDRRVDVKVSALGSAAYTLSTDQILFIASP